MHPANSATMTQRAFLVVLIILYLTFKNKLISVRPEVVVSENLQVLLLNLQENMDQL